MSQRQAAERPQKLRAGSPEAAGRGAAPKTGQARPGSDEARPGSDEEPDPSQAGRRRKKIRLQPPHGSCRGGAERGGHPARSEYFLLFTLQTTTSPKTGQARPGSDEEPDPSLASSYNW